MKTITADELQSHWQAILDEVDPEGVVITRDGEPVAKLTPIKRGPHAHLIGSYKGQLKIKGDIMSTGAWPV